MPSTLLLGCIGLGLVWGWLAGMMGAHVQHPLRYALALAAATALLGLEVLWFAGGWLLALFLGVAGAAWAAHACWRRALRRRFGDIAGTK